VQHGIGKYWIFAIETLIPPQNCLKTLSPARRGSTEEVIGRQYLYPAAEMRALMPSTMGEKW
jgi:hypothetical protein